MEYDVFICHASEDKEDFVRPLAEKLRQQHIEVWYDEFSLKIGDSLTQKIDEGLASSRFGIVVLSPNFFKKPWAKRELKGLIVRELTEERDLILPIWHRVNAKEVMKYSLPLADKKAGSSSEGINSLIRELKNKIRPNESPLIIARDYLENLNVQTPPITDEWWLDVVEYKEFLKYPDINASKRWTFPLPFPDNDYGYKRGQNIASTALQLDWSFEGEELNISPTTHPEKVHDYIHRWAGLYDCARENANILAMYAPQLTIPGFDSGFEDVFDELLKPDNKDADIIFSYGSHSTVGGKGSLCGDIIAYRHPTFGNYDDYELAHWYFRAHDTNYIRSHWDTFEGLIWLLSSDSDWLPDTYRNKFIKGISEWDRWYNDIDFNLKNKFRHELIRKSRKQFKFTKSILSELEDLIRITLKKLDVIDDPKNIIQKIIDIKLVDKFYDINSRRGRKR